MNGRVKTQTLNQLSQNITATMILQKTMGVKVILGRDINASKYITDSSAVLLNEAAVKVMGFENPVGQLIRSSEGDWHVVGVVKNFIAGDPYAPVEPIVIQGPKKLVWQRLVFV
jgi:hypothetical protein